MSDLLWYLFKIQYVYICQNYKEISSMQMSSIDNWYTSEGSCIIIYIYKKKSTDYWLLCIGPQTVGKDVLLVYSLLTAETNGQWSVRSGQCTSKGQT